MSESIYLVNMNADIENAVKYCLTCPENWNTQLQKKITPNEALAKLWVVVETDIFIVNNENLFCIVDYYNKFPKKVESMLAKDLI